MKYSLPFTSVQLHKPQSQETNQKRRKEKRKIAPTAVAVGLEMLPYL